ncbi:MAG: thermonuclease family protein [Mariprofundus sp.]
MPQIESSQTELSQTDQSQTKPVPFQYSAKIRSVYDGDTCRVDIDLGLGVWVKNESVRLYGINAPEVRGDEKVAGKISRDALREWILGKEVMLRTVASSGRDKKGKYGRYLAEIWAQDESGVWYNVNERLVAEHYAVHKEY